MHAVVCGAGIAGLAAAISLQRAGWNVTIAEHAPTLRDGGYMIDFFGPGFDAADRIGVLSALRRRGHDVDAIDWVDEHGRLRAQLHYARMRDAVDGKLLPLLRGDVERTLFEALPDGVDLRFGTTVTDVAQHDAGVAMTLGDERIDADLLIGADGVHSAVRRQVFGADASCVRPLGLHTAAWFFESADLAASLGGRFVIVNAPGRMAGAYDVGEGRLAAFLAFTEASTFLPEDPLASLRERYAGLGSYVPAMLAAEPLDDLYYDLVAQVDLPRWHSGRVILIGDAAYAVSLVAGQGASLALAGGVALGEALVHDRLAADPSAFDAALADFETRLRPIIVTKQAGGRRTAKWFVPTTPTRLAVRNAAMRLSDLPVLARFLSPFLSLDAKGFAPPSSGA